MATRKKKAVEARPVNMTRKKRMDTRKIKVDIEYPCGDFIRPQTVKKIVSSKTFIGGDWKSKTRIRGFRPAIVKHVLPIDMRYFALMVLTEVSAGTTIKEHAHYDETTLRYVVSGSFVLNGAEYGAGEWVIVPEGVAYSISTKDGYVTIMGYGMSCRCSAAGGY